MRGNTGQYIPAAIFIMVVSALLAAFFYDIGSSHGYHSTVAARYSRAEVDAARERIKNICPKTPESSRIQCVFDEINKFRENRRRELEIRSAREAVDWAFWSAVSAMLAALQVPVGIFGLYALIKTLKQSDLSLQEAKRANDIAINSARPAIRITNINLSNNIPGKPDYDLQFQFRNFGVQTGFLLAIYIEKSSFSRSGYLSLADGSLKHVVEARQDFGTFSVTRSRLGNTPLASEATHNIDFDGFLFNPTRGNPHAGELLMVSPTVIRISGFASYTDFSGKKRITGFSYFADPFEMKVYTDHTGQYWFDREISVECDDGSPSDPTSTNESAGTWTPCYTKPDIDNLTPKTSNS